MDVHAVLVLALCYCICTVHAGLLDDGLLEGAYNLTFGRNRRGHVITEADYYQMPPPYTVNAGVRQGVASSTNSCLHIRNVSSYLRSAATIRPSGLSYFYQKYTEAYGIPVVASSDVPDEALRRACYVLRFLLADSSALRRAYYASSGRVAVIGVREETVSMPEHSGLGSEWNNRTRGLGATAHAPVSTAGEENILCYRSDRYSEEDTLIHALSHGIQMLGANRVIPGFQGRLQNAFYRAKMLGLWAGTKAIETAEEYFAEGTQSYFDVNDNSPSPDGAHNHVNTREELRHYDTILYYLIREVFPCGNSYIKRCLTSREREASENVRMDCDVITGGRGTEAPIVTPATTATTTTTTTTTAAPTTTTQEPVPENCHDFNIHCGDWATQGECDSNAVYMHQNCKRSCNRCATTATTTTTTTTTAAPTTTTQEPVPGSCQDTNINCEIWAYQGECDSNPAYMHQGCKRSCNRCYAGCNDSDPLQCPLWARHGECATNSRYMLQSCRRSCGNC